LTGCVPNVEGDLVVVEFYAFDFEIYADSAEVICLKAVLAIAN
jgi:hypothetical protein